MLCDVCCRNPDNVTACMEIMLPVTINRNQKDWLTSLIFDAKEARRLSKDICATAKGMLLCIGVILFSATDGVIDTRHFTTR
jgi:hypothetical protein